MVHQGLTKRCSRPGTLGYLCNRWVHFIHDDVIKRKRQFPRYWPFVRGIHRSPVISSHKGQWRGALIFSLILVRIKDWVNNREAGDLRRRRAHYDVTVMTMMKRDVVIPHRLGKSGRLWYIRYQDRTLRCKLPPVNGHLVSCNHTRYSHRDDGNVPLEGQPCRQQYSKPRLWCYHYLPPGSDTLGAFQSLS